VAELHGFAKVSTQTDEFEMNPGFQPFFRDSLFQGGMLLLISVIAALAVNAIRPDGIALIPEPQAEHTVVLESGERIDIPLETARQAWAAGEVQFLDARPASQYAEGHIEGAISLPWLSFDQHADRVLPVLREDQTLIAYCDGVNCSLSKDLAKVLIDFGFPEVRVLVDGWSVWKEAGLPTESGEAG
jgi:rhodanese-related sulfurtransferase